MVQVGRVANAARRRAQGLGYRSWVPLRIDHVSIDDPRLGRLLQLYLHEWSAKVPVPIGVDACFVYPHRPAWRDDPGHDAVLFLAGDIPVGFALARRDEAETWHVDEMFIVAAERRRGVGKAAFEQLVALHPGRWTLTVRPEVPDALAFWLRVVGEPPRVELGLDGVKRHRFDFVCPRLA